MTKRKEDCTPEEWAKLLRQREVDNARRQRKYEADPEWREKRKQYAREYRAKNPEETKRKDQERAAKRWADPKEHSKRRARNWKRVYGVDANFVMTMLAAQKGCCAVCGTELAFGKHLHIDHCHETNAVRGLLCRACNQAEGHLKSVGLTPTAFAVRLQAYLNNPPALVAKAAEELAG